MTPLQPASGVAACPCGGYRRELSFYLPSPPGLSERIGPFYFLQIWSGGCRCRAEEGGASSA